MSTFRYWYRSQFVYLVKMYYQYVAYCNLKAWFTLGSSYALFSYFMGFCNQLLKPALLSISDCISDFKVQHKKEEKISILSRPIANLCDLLKLTNYLFEIKLTLVPISPAKTAGRFHPPYVRNLM